MQRNGPSGRVTSTNGGGGVTADLNTRLGRELRRVAGSGHAENFDLDAHLARVAAVVEKARGARPGVIA